MPRLAFAEARRAAVGRGLGDLRDIVVILAPATRSASACRARNVRRLKPKRANRIGQPGLDNWGWGDSFGTYG
jgi:hypothetical protein